MININIYYYLSNYMITEWSTYLIDMLTLTQVLIEYSLDLDFFLVTFPLYFFFMILKATWIATGTGNRYKENCLYVCWREAHMQDNKALKMLGHSGLKVTIETQHNLESDSRPSGHQQGQ